MTDEHKRQERQPTIAPGMNMHDPLEEKPSEQDREQWRTTEVTRLFIDRTPED